MKCPKCRYLSFEPELRCKHCGFDFSLADSTLSPSFDELEHQDPDIPMVDLQLRRIDLDERPAPALGVIRSRPDASPAPRRATVGVALVDRDEPASAAVALAPLAARPSGMPTVRRVPTPNPDLPLFIKGIVPPEPEIRETVKDRDKDKEEGRRQEEVEDHAVRVPSAPRPLVVRRRAPEAPRPPMPATRAEKDLFEPLRRVDAAIPSMPPAIRGEVDAPARLKAAGLDLALLTVVNVVVVLLTLRQCDLTLAQIATVPVVPLAIFLASVSFAYLLSFSVWNGQTIGKMVFGLRVVSDEAAEPTPRQLSYRALLTVPSILLLGLGFLPGLVGEGRAVHDRLTHTRVVRE